MSRYPGSVHDSAVWMTSQIRNHLVENYQNRDRYSWLLGDSGYPLEPWLINAVHGHDLNEHELNFNRAVLSTRNVSERLNGVLKS
ncbi:hypothetical protein NQ314_005901 [Rhamnusium bicolor]|uniref:DDE Tnp4 domain-containing protein n=1 Tax=Rhamnusium bicolor TaxID=1586634 RepID=A0AAV8ZBY2_9CUCU|nr:hypothetical protein NQ314_005901 [Rhamnusium bicolor]